MILFEKVDQIRESRSDGYDKYDANDNECANITNYSRTS